MGKKFLFYGCMLLGILGFLSGFIMIMNGSIIGLSGLVGGSVCYGIGYIGLELWKNNG